MLLQLDGPGWSLLEVGFEKRFAGPVIPGGETLGGEGADNEGAVGEGHDVFREGQDGFDIDAGVAEGRHAGLVADESGEDLGITELDLPDGNRGIADDAEGEEELVEGEKLGGGGIKSPEAGSAAEGVEGDSQQGNGNDDGRGIEEDGGEGEQGKKAGDNGIQAGDARGAAYFLGAIVGALGDEELVGG